MRLQQGQADRFARGLAEQILDGQEIAQGFRHLLAIDHQIPIMQPIAHKGLAIMGATTLRQFVFMVRKNQILPAAMDIEGFPQIMGAHG